MTLFLRIAGALKTGVLEGSKDTRAEGPFVSYDH